MLRITVKLKPTPFCIDPRGGNKLYTQRMIINMPWKVVLKKIGMERYI